jgi:hypothetical protein
MMDFISGPLRILQNYIGGFHRSSVIVGAVKWRIQWSGHVTLRRKNNCIQNSGPETSAEIVILMNEKDLREQQQ